MSPLARTTGFASLAAGVGVALAMFLPRPNEAPPIVITSDTRVYCDQLSSKLKELVQVAAPPPQTEVVSLGDEGRRLCDAGEVRGGILRLRRGIMLMMHQLDERGEP